MAFVFYNPNPKNQRVGDCAVRAISKAVGTDWQDAYIGLCAERLACKDMPSSNYVWGNFLKRYGFEERGIGSICPACTTIKKFAEDHPEGRYVAATQNHVVAIANGDYFDTWDSGNEIILYFYQREG